jgi:hypothetical protein
MPDQKKRAIVILGMHRSGTSAVAGAVELLGAERPASMLRGGPTNPLGYFESRRVNHVNDWLLRMAGSTWYDTLGVDLGSVDPITRNTAMALINIAISAEYGDASLLLLKDPRLCLLLDYWLPMLDAMHIEPVVLIVLRHPAEVMASLDKRDAFPWPLAAAGWLQHNLAAEHATRGRCRTLLTYDDLMTDWRGCLTRASQRAQITWPISFDAVAKQMAQRLPGDLRHHRGGVVNAKVPARLVPLIEAAFDMLLELGVNDWPPALHRLDEVRDAFATWCTSHGLPLARELLDGHVLRRLPKEAVPDGWMQLAEGLAGRV